MGYGEFAGGPGLELGLPTGATQLLVNLDRDSLRSHPVGGGAPTVTRGAAVQGPHDRPVLIDPADQRRILWVAFRAGGSHPFVPADAVELRGRLVDLDDLWGQRAGALFRERLLTAAGPREAFEVVEVALWQRARRHLEFCDAVRKAAADLDHGATVAATAGSLGWTPRRLGREFAARIGLAPKRFARVRRFQRVVRAAATATTVGPGRTGPDWARIAAEHGYHDQAHLIHDFRTFAATTPGAYRPRSAAEPNHVPISTIASPLRPAGWAA